MKTKKPRVKMVTARVWVGGGFLKDGEPVSHRAYLEAGEGARPHDNENPSGPSLAEHSARAHANLWTDKSRGFLPFVGSAFVHLYPSTPSTKKGKR